MRSLVVAVRFLTRLPMPDVGWRPGDLERAWGAFPLVGLLVAALGVAVHAVASTWWSPPVAAVATVAATVAVTGAFHEDGLADTADGWWAGVDPDSRLTIMRDSRLGTYGVSALTLVLLMRVSLLASLATVDVARAIATAHVTGRASSLLLVRVVPPLPGSAGGMVAERLPPAGTALAVLTVVPVMAVALRWWAVLLLVVDVVIVLVCGAAIRRRLGGTTGDLLGAVNQVVHVVGLAVVAATVAAA